MNIEGFFTDVKIRYVTKTIMPVYEEFSDRVIGVFDNSESKVIRQNREVVKPVEKVSMINGNKIAEDDPDFEFIL